MVVPSLRRFAPLLALAPFALGACAVFDPPPHAEIEGLVEGALSDPAAQLVIKFSEPVKPETLQLTVAREDLDIEGNLADEVTPKGELTRFFERLPSGLDDLGDSVLTDDDTTLRILPSAALPIGPRLVVLIEPGLSDREGNVTAKRRHLPFGYRFELNCDAPSALPPQSTYFMLVDVEKPFGVQIKLWAKLAVDPATGALVGRFTNASRNKTLEGCPPCAATEICRLHPAPECVAPSERAASVDEFPDFLPNDQPPTGFSFVTAGCAIDQPDGSVAFSIAPVDVTVQEPPVTLRNTVLTAAFQQDEAGVWRGTGTLSANDVLLNGNSSGAGEGGVAARSLAPGEEPPGIPEPPAP